MALSLTLDQTVCSLLWLAGFGEKTAVTDYASTDYMLSPSQVKDFDRAIYILDNKIRTFDGIHSQPLSSRAVVLATVIDKQVHARKFLDKLGFVSVYPEGISYKKYHHLLFLYSMEAKKFVKTINTLKKGLK